MAEFTYEEASERLVEAVPELKDAYRALLKRWGDEKPGQYIFYEDVFRPFLESLLGTGEDTDVVRRIFAFLETLAVSDDFDLRNLLNIAVIEMIAYYDDFFMAASRFAGPETLNMLEAERGRQAG